MLIIQKKLNRETLLTEVTFEGHAGTAKDGTDVCAMASTVFYTFLNALRYGHGLFGYQANPDKPEEDCLIRFDEENPACYWFGKMAMIGFKMLAEKYPENIRVLEDDKDEK